MKEVIFPLLLCFSVVLGYSQEAINPDTLSEENWLSITDDVFQLQYPPTWELNQSGMMGTKLILFSPLESVEDQFRDNVNLMVQDLAGLDLNLDKYTAISEEQIATLITDSKLIENSRHLTKDSLAFQKVIYTGRQGQFDLKFEQYYFVVEEKAWVLTLTCEKEVFEKYQKTGEAILNSFFFSKNGNKSKSKKI